MSYDVDLVSPETQITCRCSQCGHTHPAPHREYFYQSNHTSNTSPMWREAGIDLRDWGGKSSKDLLEALNPAILNMTANPKKYKAMNPPNGWGDYYSALGFLVGLSQACREYPESEVMVSY